MPSEPRRIMGEKAKGLYWMQQSCRGEDIQFPSALQEPSPPFYLPIVSEMILSPV